MLLLLLLCVDSLWILFICSKKMYLIEDNGWRSELVQSDSGKLSVKPDW